jgi:adenylosuccinate synthase
MRQSYSKYVTSESFKCTMAPGYITVLDVLDDMRMCHEVTFDGVEFDDVPKEEWHRYGIVYRWLSNKMHFHTSDSTVRMTRDMIKAQERNRKKRGDDVVEYPPSSNPRSVLT